MNHQTDNVQQILSGLVTNIRCLMRALSNPVGYFKEIGVNDKIADELVEFINIYSQQYLASGIFLARKRFLAVYEILTTFKKMKAVDDLDIFWGKYLFSFKLNSLVPKNPLFEALNFCEYIKNNEKVSAIETTILDYEMSRIKVILSYNTSEQSYEPLNIDINEVMKDTQVKVKLIIHPSSEILSFPGSISKIISANASNMSGNNIADLYEFKPEEIMIYKNWFKGMVTSIKLSDILKRAIAFIQEDGDVNIIITKLRDQLKINNADASSVVNALIRHGVCMMVSH